MNLLSRKALADAHGWTSRSAELQAVSYSSIYLGEEQQFSGPLILVNKAHPVRSSLPPRIRAVSGDILQAAGEMEPQIALEEECLSQLSGLLDACGGKSRISVVSGYRSKETQTALYLNSSRTNGAVFTESYVALPGASEHQTGLAVDVGLVNESLDYIRPSFPDDGVSGSFKQQAAAFGFIQRYQAGKTPITGIASEPWHFRYVGFPHSAVMVNEDLCLEEYMDFLKRHTFGETHFIFENDASWYEIYYVPAWNEKSAVPVPEASEVKWRISGNNMDGFIVTAAYPKDGASHV
ncbi:D-alanyl-D-alanine carboxypeptidase family protein [Paenibacillus sp. R14(2021)]|uniref:D-alanyl-D-alanine carboxypeptidase family protein n=1 Tax=Paenibacillus sp. R14(2021) TaxID=2859228 RepID=UPI001C615365|nr:D-alanyl-D-alanine carboxypeptidase family protein [Paenibacillus sp. R14(2021)]